MDWDWNATPSSVGSSLLAGGGGQKGLKIRGNKGDATAKSKARDKHSIEKSVYEAEPGDELAADEFFYSHLVDAATGEIVYRNEVKVPGREAMVSELAEDLANFGAALGDAVQGWSAWAVGVDAEELAAYSRLAQLKLKRGVAKLTAAGRGRARRNS